MRRLTAAILDDLTAVTRRALVRSTATVEAVDHSTDPATVTVRWQPTDAAAALVDCYRHVAVAPGDVVDVDEARASRPRIRGTVTAPRWETPEDDVWANSWTSHSDAAEGLEAFAWRVEPHRTLRLHGAVAGGTLAATILTLPDWLHPSRSTTFYTAADGGQARIVVDVDGTVAHISGGTNTWIGFNIAVPL